MSSPGNETQIASFFSDVASFVSFGAFHIIFPRILVCFSRQICTTVTKTRLERLRQLVLPLRRELLQGLADFWRTTTPSPMSSSFKFSRRPHQNRSRRAHNERRRFRLEFLSSITLGLLTRRFVFPFWFIFILACRAQTQERRKMKRATSNIRQGMQNTHTQLYTQLCNKQTYTDKHTHKQAHTHTHTHILRSNIQEIQNLKCFG